MEVKVVRRVLEVNDTIARRNRKKFDGAGLVAVNLISSPGAGKTTLLEKTVVPLKERCQITCIEGDPYTTRDAERIAALDVPVVQINTQGGCHLDAALVNQALDDLDLYGTDLLLIENVGNLLCPSQFDLGEHFTVVVLSVAEGADKPEKYPAAFRRADAVVINKIDMLALTDVDLDSLSRSIRRFNSTAPLFPLSARTGEGLEAWLEWLTARLPRW